MVVGELLPASLLKGLKQFSKGKGPAAGAGSSKETALALSGSEDKESATSTVLAKLVSVGSGLPSLSKKMIDWIISGQYVDLLELPPARGRVRNLPSTEDGHIVVVWAEDLSGTRKLILDLATWLQCFCIYMAVVTEHEPERLKSLLAYLSTIAKASTKFSWLSWVVYDQNCRQEAADSGCKDWSKVDPSTYT